MCAGLAALVVATSGCAVGGQPSANPVFEPVLADPSVVRHDGTWYAYGTEDDWGDGHGSRLVPVVRSDDLVTWSYVGEAFTERPAWANGYLWAPDVRAQDGRFLLYYAVSVWGYANPAIGVASADAPEGPFTDHGMLFDSDGIGVGNSIDPHVIDDGDGGLLMVWGSFHGIYAVALTSDGLAVDGEPTHLAGDAFEAPYLVERDGTWWFFGSLGSCCEGADSTYRVAVGRADAPLGPFVDADGTDLRDGEGTLLLAGSDRWVGPGHNAIATDDDGDDWIVYHGIDPEEPTVPSGATRRPLLIDRIDWSGGWPVVADGVPDATRGKPAVEVR